MKRANVAFFIPHRGCPHRCSFCNQAYISGRERPPTLEEVTATLTEAAQNLGERMQSAQIAFFGGSFTAIPKREMLGYLKAAQPFLGPGGFAGIRVSTRPDAVDDEVLELLGCYGVKDIELGAQSMDDAVLRACGRGHTAEQVRLAAGKIQRKGFSLGLQMMTGLPEDDDRKAATTLEALLALRPDTMRIYPTLTLEGSALAELWRSGRYSSQTLEEAVELCSHLLERCCEQGVRVIRLGLHDSPGLAEQVLDGPYHPAIRDLCESRVLLRKAMKGLRGVPAGLVTLAVAPGSISRMTGQHRENRKQLTRLGYSAKIIEDSSIDYLQVRVD